MDFTPVEFALHLKEADPRNNIQVLEFLRSRLKMLLKQGVVVKIRLHTPRELDDKDLISELKAKGVTKLPALVTERNVHRGVGRIKALLEKNVERQAKTLTKQQALIRPSSDDAMREFYINGLNAPGAGDDEKEEDLATTYAKRMREMDRPTNFQHPPERFRSEEDAADASAADGRQLSYSKATGRSPSERTSARLERWSQIAETDPEFAPAENYQAVDSDVTQTVPYSKGDNTGQSDDAMMWNKMASQSGIGISGSMF